MTVRYETRDAVAIVTIDRPERRNAVDSETAAALADAFERFDADDGLHVAVLAGAGGHFCAAPISRRCPKATGARSGMPGAGRWGRRV